MIISSILGNIVETLPEYAEVVRIIGASFKAQVPLCLKGNVIGIPVSTDLDFSTKYTKKLLREQSILFKDGSEVSSYKLSELSGLEFQIKVDWAW